MDNYITLFEKFIGLINWKLLQKYTFKLNTDFKKSKFFTHEHLASMIYFHICEHDGLRDLKQGMTEQMSEILPDISLTTLSNHNNTRDYKVFLPVMQDLINTCLSTLTKDQRLKKFGSVKMIDSTTVSMCLRFFDWAKFRKTKAGIKMHTSIDGVTGVPDRIVFSNAACHDRTQMDALITEKETIYICDKGYVDYKKFDSYTQKAIYFVSRLKDNAKFKEVDDLPVTKCPDIDSLLPNNINILFDKKVRLGNVYQNLTKCTYRIIGISDETGKTLTFVTNLMNYTSEEIAWLYKKRWDIELFFKWIKQHCKIKTLIGHSENAVRLQMITGIITYLLLRLIHHETPKKSTLISLKRKIKNLLLKPLLTHDDYHEILFNSC